jgi:RAB protein geranylgeranyltransferase component A
MYHPKPTKDENDRGVTPKSVLVTPITTVVATSDKEVAMQAARSIPKEYDDKLDNVEIVVRPL